MGMKFGSSNFQAGDQTLLIYILVGLLSLIILLVAFRYFKNWYTNHTKTKQEWDSFYQVCQRRKMRSFEVDFIKDLINKYKIARPVTIVRFLETFNRYIFREVQEHRQQDKRQREQLENTILKIRERLGFLDTSRIIVRLSSSSIFSSSNICSKSKICIGIFFIVSYILE